MNSIANADNDFHSNTLHEITKCCEKLITETQCDIKIFRNEQRQLQQQILEIIEENSRINSKLEILKKAATTNSINCGDGINNDCIEEKLTNETLKNFKRQLECLQAENEDLLSHNKILKKIIENLEKEIRNYCNQLFNTSPVSEVKQKYATAIKLLESTILNQKSELKEQTQTIENLFEQNKKLRNRIEKLEKSLEEKDRELEKLKETAETIVKLQDQLNVAEQHNKELQKSLKTSHQAIEERFKREQNALQKVQEALTIAEAAVADKEEALKREKLVKEECDNIASTIGQVMEEAASQVQKDMEAIKNKYLDKEKSLLESKQKLIEELQNQKKFNQILDTRCNRFEQKYKHAMKDNENLTNQFHVTAKALKEMEEKLKQLEHNYSGEANLSKRSAEQENALQHYVKKNRLLKDRYHTTIKDLTTKFENEILILQNDVTHLKAENQALKLQNNAAAK